MLSGSGQSGPSIGKAPLLQLRLSPQEGQPVTLLDADKQNDPNAVGEDTWELFESVERSFGVDLGDFDALTGIRVSELAETICRLANYPAREKCLSAVVFYKLRQAFETLFGAPSKSIRPTTPLKQLLPWRSRKTRWDQVQGYLDLQLPGLALPRWLLLSCLIVPIGGVIFAKAYIGPDLGWGAVFFGGLVLDIGAIYACVPLARSLPSNSETFGDLAKAVLAKNYAAFATRNAGSSEEDVLSSLRTLIASETGISLYKVLPETRIPADLNIY
jgi:hypothetical protein